jgi:D-alanine-D-alanine ligase
MGKTNVAILFGGKSAEHEVSLRSAKSIIEAIDRDLFDIHLVGIDKKGHWLHFPLDAYLENALDPKTIRLAAGGRAVTMVSEEEKTYLTVAHSSEKLAEIDVVFPVMHGSFGEDGVLQGILRGLEVAFVGADLLGAAVGMDKDVAKRLWRDAGIPVARFVTLHRHTRSTANFSAIVEELGLPLFVKPANAGSSVGVHKVTNEQEFEHALDDAFLYDRKILIEEAIVGREVEISVLGNEFPKASVVGEIIASAQFYSYEAKYIDADGAKLVIPAQISEKADQLIRETAIKAYQTITVEGLSRVDFFLKEDDTLVINEINTMPGFTSISMYPKMWEAAGLPYKELITQLIQLGLERKVWQKGLKTTND